jgi:hypothetical protein
MMATEIQPNSPDLVAFLQDLDSAEFVDGIANSHWGLVCIEWPIALCWIAPAKRAGGPNRFFVRMECSGYPHARPTGTIWDIDKNARVENALWPKGRARIAAIFRLDWKDGCAFYHPYDRIAFDDHMKNGNDWTKKYPNKLWTPKHTIVHWISEFHELLNTNEYTGV